MKSLTTPHMLLPAKNWLDTLNSTISGVSSHGRMAEPATRGILVCLRIEGNKQNAVRTEQGFEKGTLCFEKIKVCVLLQLAWDLCADGICATTMSTVAEGLMDNLAACAEANMLPSTETPQNLWVRTLWWTANMFDLVKCLLLLMNIFIFRWTSGMQTQHCYSHSSRLSVGEEMHWLHCPPPHWVRLTWSSSKHLLLWSSSQQIIASETQVKCE